MNATERKGGAGNTTNVCNLFREWFHRNQMCDLGFQGPLLLGLEGRFINSQIDRYVTSIGFGWLLTQSFIIALRSNLIIDLSWPITVMLLNLTRGNDRFALWLLGSEIIGGFVISNWDINKIMCRWLNSLFPKWHLEQEIFGNIFKWKRKLLARIGGIQKALEFDQTSNLIHLEGALKKKIGKTFRLKKKSCGIRSLERSG